MFDLLKSKTMIGFFIIMLSIVCFETNNTQKLENSNYKVDVNINQ